MSPKVHPRERAKTTRLTTKQASFVEQYVIDRNGTQAAIRAGYAPTAAAAQASVLLRNPKVKVALESAIAAQSERTHITADRVLQELAAVAFARVSKAFRPDGSLMPPHDMPPEEQAALAGIETEELFDGKGEERVQAGVSRKVKHWDKVKALEILAKHLGMLRDKVELSGEGGEPLQIVVQTYKEGDGK